MKTRLVGLVVSLVGLAQACGDNSDRSFSDHDKGGGSSAGGSSGGRSQGGNAGRGGAGGASGGSGGSTTSSGGHPTPQGGVGEGGFAEGGAMSGGSAGDGFGGSNNGGSTNGGTTFGGGNSGGSNSGGSNNGGTAAGGKSAQGGSSGGTTTVNGGAPPASGGTGSGGKGSGGSGLGGSGLGGTGSGGKASGGTGSGGTGTGGNAACVGVTTPKLDCACTGTGTLGCNGAAQKLKLICSNGIWQSNSTCSATENCDQRNGSCATILTGCSGKAAGSTYCEGLDTQRTCGADLVTATPNTCTGICSSSTGQCLSPRCGDGKIEGGEECDDADDEAADGCEPTACVSSKVTALALGGSHTCALLRQGYVRCWGDNQYGQLGLASPTAQNDRHPYLETNGAGKTGPIDVGGTVTALAAGTNHTCALLSDGSVRCWGRNEWGQLGLGHANPVSDRTPNVNGPISIGGTAIAIAAGGDDTCVILSGGTVRCWGANTFGNLGVGDPNAFDISQRALPSAYGPISLGGTATAIDVGDSSACVLLSNGTVRCWGGNGFGQLGLGHTNDIGDDELPSSAAVVKLPSGRTASAITVGNSFACARLDSGLAECWGINSNGQLGLGHTQPVGDNETPETAGSVLTGSSGVASIVAGGFSCALMGGNAGLRCWGPNGKGQLGYPDTLTKANANTTVPSSLASISMGGTATVSSVYVGNAHTCALLSDGKVRCWGWNLSGQLGLGFVSTAPVDYQGGDAAHVPSQLASVQVFPP